MILFCFRNDTQTNNQHLSQSSRTAAADNLYTEIGSANDTHHMTTSNQSIASHTNRNDNLDRISIATNMSLESHLKDSKLVAYLNNPSESHIENTF